MTHSRWTHENYRSLNEHRRLPFWSFLEMYGGPPEAWKESLAKARATGDRTHEALALFMVGWLNDLASGGSKPNDSLAYFRESLVVLREVGNHSDEARVLNEMGRFSSEQGDYTAALDYHHQALAVYQKFSTDDLEAGKFRVYRADRVTAEGQDRRTWALYEDVSSSAGEALTEETIAAVLDAKGDFRGAISHLQHALAIYHKMGGNRQEHFVHIEIARLAVKLGDLAAANDHYRKAIEMEMAIGYPFVGDTAFELAELFEQHGRLDDAVPLLEFAIDHYDPRFDLNQSAETPAEALQKVLADREARDGPSQRKIGKIHG